MATILVIAAVPVASRSAVEAAVAPYLLSPNSVGAFTFSVPLSADGTSPATHYGTCAPCPDDGQMVAALPVLVAAFPGSAYHTVEPAEYDYETHWIGWLAGLGLEPVAA